MSLPDELARLAELRDRGDLSPEEFASAKARLLAAPPTTAAPGTDGAMLLYRAVTTGQQRAAWLLAIVAVLFGAIAFWSAVRAVDLQEQASSVRDAALVERLGIRIPDPRPAIERAEFQVRATAFGGLTLVAGLFAVAAVAGALLVRPPRKSRPPG